MTSQTSKTKELEHTVMDTGNTVDQGVSIIIPTYNPNIAEIRQILASLENQVYCPFEVIIANDGEDFSAQIADILVLSKHFQFRNNSSQLGLYGSIQENMKYCKFNRVLVLEQDIVPLSPNYLSCLVELVESFPANVATSKLVIDADTDYKKYVFYKRRIANLDTFDRSNSNNRLSSNQAKEVEIAFTKADLLDKNILSELFSKGSSNKFTAQDIILTSIVHKDHKLVTSDATACEIGLRDPNVISFFLKKEFLYGNSVLDAWRHANKGWLRKSSYFKEKASRVMFVCLEFVAILALLIDLLLGGAFLVPLLGVIIMLAVFYTQTVLFRIGFWRFWRRTSHKFVSALASGVYVLLLDVAYTLGILRGLL